MTVARLPTLTWSRVVGAAFDPNRVWSLINTVYWCCPSSEVIVHVEPSCAVTVPLIRSCPGGRGTKPIAPGVPGVGAAALGVGAPDNTMSPGPDELEHPVRTNVAPVTTAPNNTPPRRHIARRTTESTPTGCRPF